MKPLLFLFLVCLLFSCKSQQTAMLPAAAVVFQSVNVIPMDEEKVLTNQDVVVRGGKIIAIGATGKTAYAKDALVVDARGKYLVPGLAEMHAHVPPVDDLAPMKDVVQLFALKGITTIRGMLGHPRHLELREKLASGEIFGPRFFTSGPSLNGQRTPTPEAAAVLVRQQKAAGYDFLKLHPGLTKETFAVMVKTAREVGIPFAGHVSFDVGVWRAISAGYATIEHLDGFIESLAPQEGQTESSNGLFGMYLAGKADTGKIQPLVKALREANIWVVPTQALAERWFAPGKTAEELDALPEMKYMPAATRKTWATNKTNLRNAPNYDAAAVARFVSLRRRLIEECHKQGVGLLLGSDAPQVYNVPGFSTHQELQYLVAAGLSPYEALKTGTVHVGRFLGRPDIGVIKKGAVSDLILLAANPLVNIAHTEEIEGVMIGNTWLPKDAIEQALKMLEKE